LEIEEDALKFLSSLPEKSRRVVKKHCLALAEDPFPGKGGDKEALHIHGFRTLYRLHVGRSYTVFYRIFEDLQAVRILDIMTIEQAHKKYGRLK
jgi:mRNA-degrading endonuclease RelE of RelBE toxin-antitoxin system